MQGSNLFSPGEPVIGCFSCQLGDQRWGFRLDAIARVLPLPTITVPVPASPPWLLGVIALEAIIAPLISPALLLAGWPGAANSQAGQERRRPDQMAVTVPVGEDFFALLVSQMGNLTTISLRELVAPAVARPYLAAHYVPLGEPEPELADIVGFLAVEKLIADCVAHLEQEEEIL